MEMVLYFRLALLIVEGIIRVSQVMIGCSKS